MKSNLFKKLALVLAVFVCTFAFITVSLINKPCNDENYSVSAGTSVTWTVDEFHTVVPFVGTTEIYFGNINDSKFTEVIENYDTSSFLGSTSIQVYKLGTKYYVLSDSKIVAPADSKYLFGSNKSKPTASDAYFSLEKIDFGNYFDTSNVTTMNFMFTGCKSLTSLDLSCFDVSSLTGLTSMFRGCTNLKNIKFSEKICDKDLSEKPSLNANALLVMFSGCNALENIENFNSFLTNFNYTNVTSLGNMFENCFSLKKIDISTLDTSNVNNTQNMFRNCYSLETITFGSKLEGKAYQNITAYEMFEGCISLELDLSDMDKFPFELDFTVKEIKDINTEDGKTNNFKIKYNRIFYGIKSVTLGDEFNGLSTYALFGDSMAFSDGANTTTTSTTLTTDIPTDTTKTYKCLGVTFTITEWNNYKTNLKGIEELYFNVTLEELKEKENYNEKNIISFKTGLSQVLTNYEKYLGFYIDTVDDKKVAYFINCVGGGSFTNVVFPDDCGGFFYSFLKLKQINLSNVDTSLVTQMDSMFKDCKALTSLDLSSFDTSNVTDMHYMFQSCINLTSLNLGGKFVTPAVKSMYNMFYLCGSLTSLDLSSFDTSNVKSMYSMFEYCSNLTSLNLGDKFVTPAVTSMKRMFFGCSKLTSLDLSNFVTSNTTYMNEMFCNCSALASLDVSNFDTSKVTSMINMFNGCSALASLDVSSFNTSKVTNMENMFYDCSALTSLNLSSFDTSKVTTMGSMFNGCVKLLSLDLSGFNTSKVTSMAYMFNNCKALTSLNLGDNFNTSIVTNMQSMFYNCAALTSLDLGSKFNTSKVENMYRMFYNCSKLTSLDVSSFDTSAVKNMSGMFYQCKALASLDLSKFNTSNVTDMSYMFYWCSSLTSLDLSSFNTSIVTNMRAMFYYCDKLTSLDVSSFDTSNVETMTQMFYTCKALASLDLSSFNTSKVSAMSLIFGNTSELKTLKLGQNFKKSPEGLANPTANQNTYVISYWTDGNTKFTVANFPTTREATTTYTWATAKPVSITEDVQAYTYDGTSKKFEIKGTTLTGFTVEYSSDGINWTTTAPSAEGTYDVKVTRLDDCEYDSYCKTITGGLVIGKLKFDMSNVKWDYTKPFAYDGTKKKVSLTGLPEGLTIKSYINAVAYEAGTYTATVIFSYDKDLYQAPDPVTLTWSIFDKLSYDMSNVKWDYTDAFEYDGNAKTVTVTGLPEGVTVKEYTFNSAKDAGTYTATVTFNYDSYEYNEPTLDDLTWEIKKATFDMSNAKWDYVKGFIYDEQAHKVEVVGLPDGITVTYENNEATVSGNYTAKATLAYDKANYNEVSIDDLDWEIKKSSFDMSNAKWDYANEFTFDEQTHKVEIVGLPDGITVTYENNEAILAGKYTAKAIFDYDKANYSEVSIDDLDWEIKKATYDMSNAKWDYTDAFTYDSESKTVVVTGLPEGVTVKAYTDNKATKAGTYTAKVTLEYDANNYEDVSIDDLEWTISKADYDMSNAKWDYTGAFTYDGTKKKVTVTGFPSEIKVNKYYGSQAFDAGTYTAKVTFEYDEENYNTPIVKDLTWVINKATLNMEDVCWSYTEAFTYNGKEQSVVLVNLPEELTPVYTDNAKTNAGTYTASVTFEYDLDNYNPVEFKAISWTINKAVYDTTNVKFESATYTYDKNVHSLAVTGLPEGLTVSYNDKNDQTNAGKYTVEAYFAGDFDNYETVENMTATLTINKAKIDTSGVKWLYSTPFTYDGETKTIYIDETTLPEGVTVKKYSTNSYATAVAKSTTYRTAYCYFDYDSANYTLSKTYTTCKWQILKAVYDMSKVTFTDVTATYDTLKHVLAIEGTLPEGVKVSYDIDNAFVNAGTYTVTASFTGDNTNYELIDSMTATMTINKATYDMTKVAFDNKEYTYDGKQHSALITGTLPEGVTVEYVNNAKDLAGTYTVTAKFTGDANYNEIPEMTATLTINKAKYNMKAVTFPSLSFVYDGKAKSLAIAGTLPEGVTVEYANNEGTNAGTYKVTAKFTGDANNYELINDMEATITIVKTSYDMSSAKWDYTNAFTYDGKTHKVEVTGLPEGVTATYADNENTNAGTYTASVTFTYDTVNYITPVMNNLTYVINKALVDAPTEGESKVYTGASLTSAINGTDLYDVANVTQTNVGKYDVTVTLKDSANYKWATGEETETRTLVFAITQADNEITGLTINGWVLGETASTPTAKSAFGTIEYFYGKGEGNYSEDVPTVAGTYLVKAVVTETKNYKGASATYEFVVRNAQVTSDDKNESGKENTIVATEKGFTSDVSVGSNTVDLSKADKQTKKDIKAEYKALAKEYKTKYNEEVVIVYSITLYKEVAGQKVEIQPSDLDGTTEVTVKFLIPSDVDTDRITRILHVHGEDVSEIEFNKDNLDSEGYYTVTLTSFSDFAFVSTKKCANHIVLIIALVLYVAFVAVCFFVLKKRSLDLVTIAGSAAYLVLVIVLTFCIKCGACIAFTIIDYVVCALGVCLFAFFNKFFGDKEVKSEETEVEEKTEETLDETKTEEQNA